METGYPPQVAEWKKKWRRRARKGVQRNPESGQARVARVTRAPRGARRRLPRRRGTRTAPADSGRRLSGFSPRQPSLCFDDDRSLLLPSPLVSPSFVYARAHLRRRRQLCRVPRRVLKAHGQLKKGRDELGRERTGGVNGGDSSGPWVVSAAKKRKQRGRRCACACACVEPAHAIPPPPRAIAIARRRRWRRRWQCAPRRPPQCRLVPRQPGRWRRVGRPTAPGRHLPQHCDGPAAPRCHRPGHSAPVARQKDHGAPHGAPAARRTLS